MVQSSYRDVMAWQRGMQLLAANYDVTEQFSSNEQFGLVSQLRRAAVSLPSKIAEGRAHYSNRDFVSFLRHARGSRAEMETQILMAGQRRYLTTEITRRLTVQIDELGRILSGLINSRNPATRTHDSGLGTQD